jgi:hypothetical protein
MVRDIINWLKRKLWPVRYDDVNDLYNKTFQTIKSANNKIKLKRSYILLEQLEELTFEKYNNPPWMINRNNTLKLLWLQKFRRLTIRG